MLAEWDSQTQIRKKTNIFSELVASFNFFPFLKIQQERYTYYYFKMFRQNQHEEQRDGQHASQWPLEFLNVRRELHQGIVIIYYTMRLSVVYDLLYVKKLLEKKFPLLFEQITKAQLMSQMDGQLEAIFNMLRLGSSLLGIFEWKEY